jgi:polyketide synthase PksL
MIDFIEYVVGELKSKRLSKADAAALVGQLSLRSSSSVASSALHPLLHRNTSDLSEQRYSSTFTGEEFFLKDHQVRTNDDRVQKVLPGVAYLEMVRAAVEQAWSGRPKSKVLELRGTVWARPIVVNEEKQISIALLPKDEEEIEYEIYSREAEQEIVHCQGRALWSHQPSPARLDLDQLKGQMGQGQMERGSVYTAFERMGILYGPAFQGIEAIYRGKGQVLAHLRLPDAAATNWEVYPLHPALLDSALQACIGLVNVPLEYSDNQPKVPFALECLRIISCCSRVMFAWVRYAADSKGTDSIVKLDLDLCDEAGNLCAEIRGFSYRSLRNEQEAPLHLREDMPAGLQLFVPVWNPILPEANANTGLAQSKRLLLLGGNQVTLEWVQRFQPDVQQVFVPPPETIDRLEATLKHYSFDQLLWVAPDVTQDATYPDGNDTLIEQQELGVLCVFQIIKALLRLGYGYKELRWTVITSNTQNVTKDAGAQPAHSGILGLIGSVAKEYPQWDLCLLDVDSLDSLTLTECLSMKSDKRGNSLAYRKGEWFRQEFAYLPSLPRSEPLCYRQNGVYVVIGGAGGLGEVWTQFMMENYQASVVWIGRRKYDATIENKINSLARLGRAPLYISADASNLRELEEALQSILQSYPVIHGAVHSAIILRDQSIAGMEESDFKVALSAKLDTSVNLDRVFGQLKLDFMLFFSSATAFIKAAGQSNYAAGCTFEDCFAESLRRRRAYPIKIINWGYWDKVGIVAGEHYNKTMERVGIGSIEPNEGMACLQTFMASPLAQIGLIKTKRTDAQAAVGVNFSEKLTCYPSVAMTPISEDQRSQLRQTANEGLPPLEFGVNNAEIEALSTTILAASLRSLGLFREGISRLADLPLEQPPPQFYERWLNSSISYLQGQNFLDDKLNPVRETRALGDLWREWEREKAVWKANPDLGAQVDLLEACLKGLPDILGGRRLATDVIFPNSSMRLVEGVYRDNALADYFNEVLRNTLLACIEQMRLGDSERKIRILEIGAGTGGSTAKLLSLLRRFPIEEYCYTDVSRAFLLHADERYRPRFPALTTAVFDVSKPPELQSIAAGYYDVVIAANVLHATSNIRETLRNAKATLKHHGVLLLNEISNWSLFAHLTFGLLEGWWLHQDTPLRLSGSPGLSPERWREILKEEGYQAVFFPAEAAHKLGQQIIVGSSDGWVRQPVNKLPVAAEAPEPSPSGMTKAATAKKELAGAEQSLREKSTIYFQKLVGSVLKIRPDQIELRRPLVDYGLDSILVGQLTYQLRKRFTEITGTLFFEVQTIDGLVDYFLENKKEALITEFSMNSDALERATISDQPATVIPEEVRLQRHHYRISRGDSARRTTLKPALSLPQAFQPATNSSAVPTPIFDVAVIGLSGRYPRSSNLKEFWANLANGVNCIAEIPRERWDWQDYYDPEKGKSGKMYTKWGGFIDGIDQFDPLFFKISPVEAKNMDPQERLFLESSYHAIEDAGYTPENLGKPEKVGVFVGVMNSRYARQPGYFSIANRVSYLFNFQGPSMAVDTACSASLTAIHLALESLYSGWTDCAIAGGVNLIIDPIHYLQLAEMTMLSSGNRGKAFGDQADGFIDAEGVGAVVLKPLTQAQADGDHIYGVIKSSAVNSGGRTNGYTVPNPIAQAKVVTLALERAKIPPEYISYIEAHGTGTALGDPIEIAGLTRAFREAKIQKQFCSIGSLKSNIGHCESAAGIAGLTKVLLQLRYEQLVPSLHAETPNPEIDFSQTPFKVQKQLESWPRPLREVKGAMQEIPRIAGVSSFGAGGANAHIIVQEYLPAEPSIGNQPRLLLEDSKVAIVLSARGPEQLRQKARDLLEFVLEEERFAAVSGKAVDLAAMGYTLQVGREAMEERLGLIVKTVGELVEKLEGYVKGKEESEGRYEGQAKRNQETLKLLNVEGAMQDVVARWIEQGKSNKVVELWAKGMEVEWAKLYGEKKSRRMSLPLYPFARERYWQEVKARGAEGASEKRGDGRVGALHPMLHRNVSDLNEQRYSTKLNGEEFYLRDHRVRVDGDSLQKVMPGVAYLEMTRAAMEEALPQVSGGRVLELRDIVWVRPMIVSRNKQVCIRLMATESREIEYEIYSRAGEEEVVHGQGRAMFTEPEGATANVDVEKLRGEMTQGRIEAERLYARLRGMGLEHGRGMRAVRWVERGQGQVLAELRVPEEVAERGNYRLHPSLLDGALQAAVVIVGDGEGTEKAELRVPYALDWLRVEGECGEEMLAWVRRSEKRGEAQKIEKLDIDLCDCRGKVAVQMRGLSLRPLSKQSSKAVAKDEGVGSLIAVPVWETRREVEQVGAERLEYAEEHRIVCGLPSVIVEELRKLLPQSQWLVLGEEEKEALAERYGRCALACFERMQKILRRKTVDKVLVQIVIGDRPEQMVLAGLVGMVKTARLENPQLIGQVVVAEEEMGSQQLAQALEAEKRREREMQVRYRGGERQELHWEEVGQEEPLQEAELGVGLKEDGVYLITGGLGRLGEIFAKEILGRKRRTRVIVTGRRELNAEKQARLEGWSEGTGRVRYRQVDLEDEEEVKVLMRWIKAEFGVLNGIVHSAGMIADNFMVKKTKEEFAEVLGPKVKGTYNLDEASVEEELDFFVLFSSVAGAMGNLGQADYAAANGFMDRYAEYRNAQVALGRRKGRTRSINWGLWKGGGMNMAVGEREVMQEATGLEAMDTETGIAGFYRSLGSPYEQVLVVAGDVKKMRGVVLGWREAAEHETVQGARMEVEATQVEAATQMDSGDLAEKMQERLRKQFSELLQLSSYKIDPHAALETYGMDSILALKLTRELEKTFGPLPKTLFFEYQNIADLARYFATAYPKLVRQGVDVDRHRPTSNVDSKQTIEECPTSVKPGRQRFLVGSNTSDEKEIAIVGLAGRYPQAANLREFWSNLQNGRDCITEIPSERWDNTLYFDPDRSKLGKTYSKWGGFIADVDKFDPLFFNITPKEAELIDPQERLFLETVWETIEDAGYSKDSLYGKRVGVFVGVMWGQYELFGVESILSGGTAIPISSHASIANRVSYFFDFHGPSIALDTMCSSSMTAIYLACQELRNGTIDAAIAGGVNLTIHPYKYLSLSQGKFAASDGKCRSFGEGGDGYVPGEGVGAVLLKPLANALRDRDQVYAVIKSSTINHGGKTNGYTVPNPNAQGDLIREAITKAHIDPRTLSYIETHGTGTSLGDPIEITGLLKVYEGITEKQFCPIGSVKSNIGHLESAAGIAAITKALLQIRNKQLVPSLHADPLNPNINFKDSPFYVQSELTEWKGTPSSPRRVGVSSFGAGGSNAHLILEEYAQSTEPAGSPAALPEICVFSAKDQDALCRLAESLISSLGDGCRVSLADMAYTLQVGRTPMDARLAIVASSLEDLKGKLVQWKNCRIRQDIALNERTPELEDIYSGHIKDRFAARDLIEGQAGTAFLEGLLANRKLQKIARLWVLGVDIDWLLMHRPSVPKKVSLPTYPFAKERCWVNHKPLVLPVVQETKLNAKESVTQEPAQKKRTYYLPQWTVKPISVREEKPALGPILILDSSEQTFRKMKGQLENTGDHTVIMLVRHGKSFREIEPTVYEIDPAREEQFHDLVQHLKGRDLLPRVIVHHDSEVCDLEDAQQVDHHLDNLVYALFYLCKALIKAKHQVPLKIVSAFSSDSQSMAPLNAALGGFLKTMSMENPRYLVKAVDIEKEAGKSEEVLLAEKVNLIWDEIYDENWTVPEIRYRIQREASQHGHTRYVNELLLQTLDQTKLSSFPLKPNGVYLITGGLGGLGFIFSDYLAKRFQARLVLVGRSAPNAGQQEKIRQLKSYGSEVLPLQADVSNLEQMQRVIRETKAHFTEIDGVIHSAGVNRDSFILKKTKEEIESVLASKVYGTINVDLATSQERLDFFVLFSSVAGVMGNFGQSDYAYANHFLDFFAERRESLRKAQKRSGRTVSINWPLWEAGGMNLSPEDIGLLEKRTGICPMPTHEGIQYWEDFLRSGTLQGVALYGIPSRIAAYISPRSAKAEHDAPGSSKAVDMATLFAKTEAYLKALIGEEIKLAPERIGSSDRLEAFGIDSVMINRLNTNLEKDLGALPKTLLYEHETVAEVAQFLLQQVREALITHLDVAASTSEPPSPSLGAGEQAIQRVASIAEVSANLEQIAIIGIHGYYPHSENLDEFWENLKRGRKLIDLVPPNRWSFEEFYDPDPAAATKGKIYCKWGGFLDNYDKFDPLFFNISPEEARIMDPQERLFLQSVWAAIEDAGYTRDSLKKRFSKDRGADVGVFVGVTTNSYHLWAPEERSRGNYLCPSAMPWSIANRVSYFFDFNGPSMPVDTACSSSLVAVHLACESLRRRECQIAIAGGVNLYLHPYKYQSLCQNRMLSLDGMCHSYGAGDDGFVPGEGVGTLVLKPLSQAIADHDQICSIIRASAYDHSGRSKGYSAPNPNAQANVIGRALRNAQVPPESVGCVEGHGTGTQLGDSLEVAALTRAFQKQTAKKQFCSIGSVKANIGHSESAAGMASLTKVVLQIQHRQLVPSLCSDPPNPNIEFEKSPFCLQHRLSEWESFPGIPRRALINSFGAGGVNACVILEEYEKPNLTQDLRPTVPYLFVLSARNEERLREYVAHLLTWLKSHPGFDLASLCYTLQVGREAMGERLAMVVSDGQELIDRLSDWSQQGSSLNICCGNLGTSRASKSRLNLQKVLLGEQSIIEIASMWAAGQDMDWETLYPTGTPFRISLPSYPFARERYWISDSLLSEKPELPNAQVHPLISYNSSTLREVSFSSRLSDAEFYALDHEVNKERIFPGAGFLEMACFAGNIAGEQRVRKLKDAVWIHPLSFQKGPRTLRILLRPAVSDVKYEISSVDEENEVVLYSEGRLVFGSVLTDVADAEDRISLEALKTQCSSKIDGSTFYEKFRKCGLNYGPSFRSVQEIFVSDSFALAKLKLADHLRPGLGQFILHPSLIDGAWQTAAGLIGDRELLIPYLPFVLDEVDILHPLRQTCYAYAEFADFHGPNPDGIRKFNIRLVNESGDVLVRFKHLFCKAFTPSSPKLNSPVPAALTGKAAVS